MHKRTQGPSVDHQPGYERAELSRCEDVDLEHGNRMRTDWFAPDAVDSEFGEFMADAGPQLVGERGLGFVFLRLVRVRRARQPSVIVRPVEGEGDVGWERRGQSFRTWKK